MQIIRKVRLCQVRVVDRFPLNSRTYELAMYLDVGGKVPPIHVKKMEHGQYHVLDGRHRWVASKLIGAEWIEVRYGIREPQAQEKL